MNTKYQAAAGRAGPAAAWYFVLILNILDISWLLFTYFCIPFLVFRAATLSSVSLQCSLTVGCCPADDKFCVIKAQKWTYHK